MSGEDILSVPPPPADQELAYGSDPNQFVAVRIPRGKGQHPVLFHLHGGYWRAKYDLRHAGHLCESLRKAGVATFNVEYRRVGNKGGGWPGTFEDIRSAYRFVQQSSSRFGLDLKRFVVTGHSAGGQLALALAAHESSVMRVISLAGVVDLRQAYQLHLSNDAVVEFLGGKPSEVPEHYHEADPAELHIPKARQWLLHGTEDDTVPVAFSREYAKAKKRKREHVEFIEIEHCGHFDLINPQERAFQEHVIPTVLTALV